MSTASAPRPRSPKASEAVADEIRAMIAHGRLRPGDSLPIETALMEHFGIARPTMREVLRLLESDGLIEIRKGPGGGPVVTQVTAAPLARRAGHYLATRNTPLFDLMEAQTVIEPGAARLAATHRTEADLAVMRDCISEAAACTTLVAFARPAARFHLALIEASGNITLQMVAGMLRDFLTDAYERTLADADPSVTRAVIDSSLVWYSQLADALEAGEPDRAERIWRQHQHMARHLSRDVISGRSAVIRLYPDGGRGLMPELPVRSQRNALASDPG
ncbi:GntR family transcriptional regulator [Frankia sp. AiPs1]|uniref:FadR/GntR family transcriptional regulator n=1 Tax=Frankia sp. AiPs1 TaxID=573493 RepID=UPI0020446E44|nr:FCD domain-containing protein [Frankia sp. AiPs1]MCM3921803.1 GntR family transcriptional regulator [Frankia sp. AiPs1]